MSNHKHLADLLKVCSILPALAIMPAMAGTGITLTEDGGVFEYNEDSDMYTMNSNGSVGSFSGYDASDRFEASIIFVGAGQELSVSDGAVIQGNKAQVGGAIAITGNDAGATLNIGQGVKFLNNTALFDGGAIGNYGNTIVANGVLFQGNKAQLAPEDNENQIGGGAISLGSKSNTTMVNTDFIGNESGYNGGAIGTRLANRTDGTKNNNSLATLKISGGKFTGNKANGYKNAEGKQVAGNGGAIYNTFYADVVVEDVDFEDNYAAKNGGAIYNDGTADENGKGGVMTIAGSSFEGNEASRGGAIFNSAGKMDILGTADKRVVFEDNKAYVGGAFTDVYTDNAETFIKGALFEENHAGADAGAAGFYGKVDVENTIFRENTAAITVDGVTADIGNSDGGGAILVGGTSDVSLTKVQFVGNESGARGGAISARHGTGYELDIDTATFTTNKSGNFGGGIANVYGGTVNMNNVDFVSNSATKAGGAIYNGKDMNYGGSTGSMSTNHGILNIAGTNTFTGNTAGEFGGAIYNDNGGTINMSGTNTFANNTHGEYAGANDIYNLGTLIITDGTTTIGGGIAGNEGTLVLENGAKLNIGTALIQQGTVNLDGVIVASAMNSTSFGRFAGDVTVGENATLDLTVGSVGTYDIFAGKTIDVSKVTVGDTYLVESGEDGIVITTKAVEDIAADTGLTTQAAGAIAGLANATDKNLQKISLAAQQVLNSGDVAAVERETKKLNPTDKPVAQATAASVQNQVLSLTSGRMAGGVSVGRAGGDAVSKENGFWMQGLFNKSKLADEFNGYTRGFALGADLLIDNKWTIGGGLAVNDSDVRSNTADIDIDSKTVFMYGQYKPNNWFVNATATYSMSEYTENKNPFGVMSGAAYDVESYGVQAMGGYDFAAGITAEAGLRYLHIAQDAYTDDLGFKVKATDTDFLSGVAGLKYAFAIENDWKVRLRPELRAAMTYDFISDDIVATVAMPGVASYKVDVERLSRMGGEFGIGLTALYRGMEVSLMYDLDLHKDYTSQTGMIKFRGQF